MYLNLNGESVYYQKIGKGKDLILLHGWKQDVSTWYPVIDLLKEDFVLWLIDLPGFGRSDLSKKALTPRDYSEIIFNFLKKNNLKKVDLLGHSLGGAIAIKIATDHPEVVNRLILEAPSGIRETKSLKKKVFFVLSKIFNLVVPNLLNLKQTLRYKFYKSINSDYLGANELKGTLINILNEDISNELKKISIDTLIIAGEKDGEIPLSVFKKMYKQIPNSRLEIFEDVGHFPHLESKERFTNYVKDFSTS
ncbi:alpha/beta hydrolase [Candidatus Daviesbacteria bacterium]|nr:alpha/beta hydrolase [Candidatus Daviesbacteria bacterium]